MTTTLTLKAHDLDLLLHQDSALGMAIHHHHFLVGRIPVEDRLELELPRQVVVLEVSGLALLLADFLVIFLDRESKITSKTKRPNDCIIINTCSCFSTAIQLIRDKATVLRLDHQPQVDTVVGVVLVEVCLVEVVDQVALGEEVARIHQEHELRQATEERLDAEILNYL